MGVQYNNISYTVLTSEYIFTVPNFLIALLLTSLSICFLYSQQKESWESRKNSYHSYHRAAEHLAAVDGGGWLWCGPGGRGQQHLSVSGVQAGRWRGGRTNN